jgi:hypothetical protein
MNAMAYLSTVSNGATLAIWDDGQEKGKKRHLTEGMTEKTLTDLTVLMSRCLNPQK